MRNHQIVLTLFFFAFITLVFGFSGRTWADTPAAGTQPVSSETYSWKDKIKRGGLNIVSSPVEIARQIQITSDEKNMAQGWTVGLAKGLGQGLLRLGAGIVDVLTCPFNFPDEHKAPMIQPEYVWQKPGVKYS